MAVWSYVKRWATKEEEEELAVKHIASGIVLLAAK